MGGGSLRPTLPGPVGGENHHSPLVQPQDVEQRHRSSPSLSNQLGTRYVTNCHSLTTDRIFQKIANRFVSHWLRHATTTSPTETRTSPDGASPKLGGLALSC
jgi:hypothetical protein